MKADFTYLGTVARLLTMVRSTGQYLLTSSQHIMYCSASDFGGLISPLPVLRAKQRAHAAGIGDARPKTANTKPSFSGRSLLVKSLAAAIVGLFLTLVTVLIRSIPWLPLSI
jgi:hypothetical protein